MECQLADFQLTPYGKALLSAAWQRQWTGIPTRHVAISSRVKRWQFPRDPFIAYEPKDEAWCRPLGIGHEAEVTQTLEFPSAVVSCGEMKASGGLETMLTAYPSMADYSHELKTVLMS